MSEKYVYLPKYDIMVYGPGVCEPAGQMTKEEAEENIKTRPAGFYTIGWVLGTCQSVFKFWVPRTGMTVELLQNEEIPIGRCAAVLAERAKQ